MRELPLVHQYGNGEPGLVWRELAASLVTSAWVRAGDGENFPLLHHHRVLAVDDDEPELVLVFEHLPSVLSEWVDRGVDDEAAAAMIARAWPALDVLEDRGLTHFDTHWGNVLTDGARLSFAAMGLAMYENFALSDAERAFRREHASTYDHALFARGLLRVIFRLPGGGAEMTERILAAPDIGAEAEQLGVPHAFATLLARFGEVAWIAFSFMNKVKAGEPTPYPREALEGALAKARNS